jgi:hypothetical protein
MDERARGSELPIAICLHETKDGLNSRGAIARLAQLMAELGQTDEIGVPQIGPFQIVENLGQWPFHLLLLLEEPNLMPERKGAPVHPPDLLRGHVRVFLQYLHVRPEALPGRHLVRSVGNTRAVCVSTRALSGGLGTPRRRLPCPIEPWHAAAAGPAGGPPASVPANTQTTATPRPRSPAPLAATPPRLPRRRGCFSPRRLRAPCGGAPDSSNTADRGSASGRAPRSPRPPRPGSGQSGRAP